MANVRRMEAADVEACLELAYAMAQESPRYRDKGWNKDKLRDFTLRMIGVENHGWFVADEGGAIIGVALGFLQTYFFSDELYAADLAVYVTPEHRGSSTALRLVRALEQWAFASGARELTLGTSTETNAAQTVCVYQKLGYKMSSYGLIKTRESPDVLT